MGKVEEKKRSVSYSIINKFIIIIKNLLFSSNYSTEPITYSNKISLKLSNISQLVSSVLYTTSEQNLSNIFFVGENLWHSFWQTYLTLRIASVVRILILFLILLLTIFIIENERSTAALEKGMQSSGRTSSRICW